MRPTVLAVSSSPLHNFSKHPQSSITLIAGLGVEGDAHSGKITQHRYLVKKDPTRPNLSQVHLLHSELHDQLNIEGFDISPGQIGENILTRDVDLMSLPTGTLLHLGESAIVQITGLREPCSQLNNLRLGLMKAVFRTDPQGAILRNAGIMAIVTAGGKVQPHDKIRIQLPPEPHHPLQPV